MADDREKGSLVVDITAYCDDELMSECNLTMELDDEYNSGNSCFAVGENAYFRIYGNISYSCRATLGTPRSDSRGVGLEITNEYVDFSNWSASTIYPVNTIKSYEWIGKSLGTIHKAKGSNSLTADKTKHEGYGVAKITYTTRYDRWKHSSPTEADVIVYAHGSGDCEDTKVSLTLQFRDDCAGDQNNTVTLTYKNYKTGAVIQSAAVWVDGVFKGYTDSHGQIYLGLMSSGTHTVKATHASYTPTEADLLGNDSFVVSGT
jgi:hypothetical protein